MNVPQRKEKLSLPVITKYRRRIEAGEFWFLSKPIRLGTITVEAADAKIERHKLRAGNSEWFTNRLNELQEFNKKRHEQSKT